MGVGATRTGVYDPPCEKADLPTWSAGIARPGHLQGMARCLFYSVYKLHA
jgi:hypothetical protein